MTITSLPTTASPGPHPAGKTSDPTAPDATALGFLAELAAAITSVGNLAQVTGALPGTVPTASSEKAGTTATAAPVTAAGPVLTAVPGLIAGLPGTPLAAGPPAAPAAAPGAAQVASVLPTQPGLPAAAPAFAAAATVVPPASAAASPTVVAPVATPAATAVPATPVAVAPVVTAETTPTLASRVTPATVQAVATPVRARHGARSETPTATAATPEPAPSADPSALLASTSSAAPAAATTPVATANRGQTTAVLQQVFPEISKLATAGNGTHRVTITLHPEDLGTVRVTLSVRDGNVRVTLAADQATSALAAGQPELQRLLEQHGATDTRIVVRDLGTSTPNLTTTTGGDSRQPGQQQAAYTPGGYAEDTPRGRQERPAVVPNPRSETSDRTSTNPAPSTRRAASGVDQLI